MAGLRSVMSLQSADKSCQRLNSERGGVPNNVDFIYDKSDRKDLP